MPTQTPKEIIAGLYAAVFNRAPDKAGLDFWAGQADGGDASATEAYQNIMDPAGDTTGFVDHPVFATAYNDLSNAQFAAKIYENALGQAGDQEGINFWTTQLDLGMSRGDMVVDFVEGALTGDFTAANFPNLTPEELSAARERQDYLTNKVEVAIHWVAELGDKTNVTDANDPTNDPAYIASQKVLEKVNQDAATVDHMNDIIDQASAAADSSQFITDHVNGHITDTGDINLTVGIDKETGNVFNAERVNDGDDDTNSLDDDDELTGTGTNPTLNFTYVNDDTRNADYDIAPTLTGIETINLTSDTDNQNTLDLQDGSASLKTLNIKRVDATTFVDNLTSTQENLSLTNSSQASNSVGYFYTNAAVSGAADTTTLTLSNVNVNNLWVQETARDGTLDQGYETINLVSSGTANRIDGALIAEDLATLNITGDQNLRIDSVPEAGSLTTVDASGMTGTAAIDFTVSGGVMSQAPDGSSGGTVGFAFTGTGNDDTLRISETVDANDTLAGGAGTDELTMSQTVTDSFFDGNSSTATGFETITVNRADAPDIAGIDANNDGDFIDATDTAPVVVSDTGNIILRVDLDKIEGDQSAIVLQNLEGSNTASTTTFDLNEATAAEATAVRINHSGNAPTAAGNNGVLENVINLDVAAGVTTAGITIGAGLNNEPRFNFTLTADSDGTALNATNTVTGITLTDSDAESNSVRLTEFSSHTGTITVDGGVAGNFLNLDSTANGYGYDQLGTGPGTGVLATDDALARAQFLGAAVAGSDDAAVSSVFNTIAAVATTELLVATSVDAADYAGDLILRTGTANQNIQLGTGNDTVIFADRTGITTGTAGLTIQDTVSGGTGTDTVILDGTGVQTIGASEWTNLTGVDQIRLAGQAGSTFNLTVTDQLVDQTDAGNRITIINNDGLNNNALTENTATIDLTTLSATNAVTFVGPNDNNDVGAVSNVQTVIVDDVTANGTSILNGGDADNVTEYTATGIDPATGNQFGSQAAADAIYNARANVTDGNNNIYQVNNNAEVTVGDLSQTSNFDTIAFRNTDASNQTLTVTLDGTTIDNMVDASHTANTTATELLTVNSTDNLNAAGVILGTSSLTLDADDASVTAAFNTDILAGRGNNDIKTGAGNDSVTLLGNYNAADYAANTMEAGVDISTLHTGTDKEGADLIFGTADDPVFIVGGSVAGASTMALGAGANTVDTYGAISLVDFTTWTGVGAVTAHSHLVMTATQFAATGVINFVDGADHTLEIIDDGTGAVVDLSKVNLSGTGSLKVFTDSTLAASGSVVSGAVVDTSTGAVTVDATRDVGDEGLSTDSGAGGAADNTLTAGIDDFHNTTATQSATFAGVAAAAPTANGDINIATTNANLTALDTLEFGTGTDTLTWTDPATVTINTTVGGADVSGLDQIQLADVIANNVTVTAATGNLGLDIIGGTGQDIVTVANVAANANMTFNLGGGADNLDFADGPDASAGAVIDLGDGDDTVRFGESLDFAAATSIAGGNGTDILQFEEDKNVAVLDAAFAGVTSIETLTLAAAVTTVSDIDLDGLAQLAGIRTVILSDVDGHTVDVGSTYGTLAGANDIVIDATAMADDNSVDIGTSAADMVINLTAGDVAAHATNTTGDLTVNGGTGTNVIVTGAGDDTIIGGAGADTITGGAGADTITGGAGADTITGGAGADVFNFADAAADTGITVATADTIIDFATTSDTIDIGTMAVAIAWVDNTTAGGFNETATTAVADFAAALGAANAILTGTVDQYVFNFDATNGYLFIDDNGTAGADSVIILTGIDTTEIAFGDIIA